MGHRLHPAFFAHMRVELLMKRGQTDLCAVIAVDKLAGCTSHDVVNAVRGMTGERRVGHAGTLDPFATGILLMCIGPATRLSDRIMADEKSYIARIVFGVQTSTDDCTGAAVACGDESPQVLDQAFASEVLSRFTGRLQQLPPQYSAKKLDGRRAYDLARKGQHAEVASVEVTVSRAELLGMGRETATIEGAAELGELPYWDVSFRVSKGTYIRSLARDIGQVVGCGAHLSQLRRTSVGPVGLWSCVQLDQVRQLAQRRRDGEDVDGEAREFLLTNCLDPVRLLGLPAVQVDKAELDKVGNGAPLSIAGERVPDGSLADNGAVAIVNDGRLYAVYQLVDARQRHGMDRFESRLVIPGGVAGASSMR